MKLFQQLVVALPTISLLTPLAASTAETSLTGVSSYKKNYGINTTTLTHQTVFEIADSSHSSHSHHGKHDGVDFETSTKMMGQAVFTTGFIDTAATADNKLTSEYSFMLMTHTSFTGQDHLFASIDQGNHNDLQMDSSMNMVMNSLTVSSLFYQFPVGDFQLTAGPLVDQDDVISANTSIYSDAFRLSGMRFGASGAMNETGPGIAIAHTNSNGFNGSISLVADDGENSTKGIFTREGDDILTASIGYDSNNYGGGLIYKRSDENGDSNGVETFGGGVYFRPEGFPTISVMYDTSDPEGNGTNSKALMVGLDHPIGNGVASAAFESHDDAGTTTTNHEVYYNYPVNDSVSVQGGFFSEEINGADNTQGVVVETFFTF